jgi:transposase
MAGKVNVSDLRDDYKLQPSLFYRWQQQAMENLVGTVEPTQFEAKLVRKDSVIAGVSEGFVKQKRQLGEL